MAEKYTKTKLNKMTTSQKAKIVKSILEDTDEQGTKNAVSSLPKALFPEASTDGEEAVRRRKVESDVQTATPEAYKDVVKFVNKPYTTIVSNKPSFKTRSMLDNFDPLEAYDVLTTPSQKVTVDPSIAYNSVLRTQQYIDAAKNALDEYEKSRPVSYQEASASGAYTKKELDELSLHAKENILAQETWDRENRGSDSTYDTWDNTLNNMSAVSDDYLKYIRDTVIPQNISAVEEYNAQAIASMYDVEIAGDQNRAIIEAVTDIYRRGNKNANAEDRALVREVFGENLTDSEVSAILSQIHNDPETFLEKSLTDTTSMEMPYNNSASAYEQLGEDISSELASREAYNTLMTEAQSSPTYEQDKVFQAVETGRANGYSGDMNTLYMWLNDDAFRNKYNNANSMSMTQSLDNPFTTQGYDYMTDEELAGFNAAYAQGEEAAERYMSSLNATGVLNRRRAEALVYASTNLAEEHPALAYTAALGGSLATDYMALPQLVLAATGVETDTNSSLYDVNRFTDTIRGRQQEMVGENGIGATPILGTTLGALAYNGLTALLDNMLVRGVSGAWDADFRASNPKTVSAINQILMSGGAASNTLYSELQNGTSSEGAVAKALAAGFVEALTEKYSLETLLAEPETLGKAIWKNFIAEGSEEMASDILNPIADAVISGITGDQTELRREYEGYLLQGYSETEATEMVLKNFVQEMTVDGLIGGMVGGVSGASVAIQTEVAGSQMKKSGAGTELVQIAKAMPEGSKSRKYAEAVERTGSSYSTARLYAALSEEMPDVSQETLDNITAGSLSRKLQSEGEEGDADSIARSVMKVVRGQELTNEERNALVSSSKGIELMNTISAVSERDSAEMKAYYEAYNAGFYGRESTQTMNQTYYQQGVKDAQEAEQRRLANVGKGKAGTGSVSYIGTVLSDSDISKKNAMKIGDNTFTHLEEQQQIAAAAIQDIAKATSLNFVLYEGQADDSGAITIENGKYEPMTNTLYIDLNSGKNRSGQGVIDYTIMQTVAHETTHFIASNSKSGYATFQNLVRKTLEERGQDFDELVRKKVRIAELNGKELTLEGAVEEVMADASEMMLKDTKVFQQLAKQNKSLVEKVKTFVSDLLSKIRKALGKVSAQHPEAKALMEAEQYVAGLQEAWDAALVEAVETVKGGETGETWHGIPVVEKFELRSPVEKKGNLVATHAVSDQNLNRMLDEGTMVGLSLAVAQADSRSSSMFGTNTLVFYASAIDPESNPDNHIFGFDAWTPRRPKTVYAKNENAIQQARESYVKTLRDSGIDAGLVKSLESFFDKQLAKKPDSADAINTRAGIRNVFFDTPYLSINNTGIAALYALDVGLTAEDINEAYRKNARGLLEAIQSNPETKKGLEQLASKITSGFYESRMWEPGITDANETSDSTIADITVANTPENALAIMKQKPLTDQGDSAGADGIRRKIPLVYNNLDEVRNDQGRLSAETNITEEDLHAAQKALAKFKNEVSIGRQSTAKIDGILQNAAANNHRISDTVRALWKAGYIKANKKNVGEVMEAIQSFRNSPTNYFEAKLMRKSSFSEVAAAVVKESSTDLISRLEANGIRVLTYDGTIDDRVAKVNSVNEAKFSLRDSEYTSAVESGDMDTAQKMVDEAAKDAGYTIRAYHGTGRADRVVEKFELRSPVEKKGELIAVHNIKQDDLLATLRLGGFPMPSIAIIKSEEGHTMYGDYSVIFGKDTIDPQADKANKVYGADAWTPVFPAVETEIMDDVMYKVQQEMDNLAGQVDPEYARNTRTWFGNFAGLDATDKTMADIQDSAWNNSGMVAAYLADHGENVDILEKDVPVKRDYYPARASVYDKVLDIVPLHDIESMKARDLLDTYGDQLAESIHLPFARLNTLWKNKNYDAGKRMLDLLHQAKSYENSGRDTSVQTKKAKDFYATYTAMKESIDRDGFNAWVAQKMQGAFGAQGIYNGKDLYTPSGNRRSFKNLHYDLTADNVVKSMLTQDESYILPTNAKGLIAASSRMYKSIAEIKDDASRLGKISEEKYNAKIAGADNMYHDFLNAIEAWDVTKIEDVGELLVQAAKKQMNASAISALFKRNGYSKATLNASKMAKQLIDTVQSIPTGYFEAKPQRVVDFNEIRMVIAPDTMGSELASALNERSIPYTTYAANDEADRLAKLNSVNEAKFSLRETDQFKRWFKNSEVVDSDGNPKIVYHATDAAFTVFDRDKLGSNTRTNTDSEAAARSAEVGFWFSDHDLSGDMYTDNSMPVYLSIKNGYQTSLDNMLDALEDVTAEEYVSDMESQGYDGLIVQDSEFGGTSYVVFEPEQIKSATDNVGTFDPDNPDIRYYLRAETEADLTRQYLESMEITDSMNESEKWLLGKYQRTQAEIAEKEAQIAEQDELKVKAPTPEDRTKAENRAKILRDQVKRLRNAMRTMERSDGFGGLMRRSEDVVKRYMQYSDVTQATDLSDQLNADLTSLNSQLESAVKTIQSTEGAQRAALAKGMLNEQSLTQAGKNIRSTFGSRMSGKEISNRLALAYAELYAADGEQGVQNFTEVMRNLAQDVLRRSNRRYHSTTLDDLRENLQGSISLSEAQKQELKNAGISQSEFKRVMSGVVNVSASGTSLASIVSSAEYYGSGIISQLASTDSEGDMILKLYNLVSEEKTKERSFALEGMNETDSINYTMAEIMSNANIQLAVDQNTMDAIQTAMKQGSETNQKVVSRITAAMKNVRSAKITGEQLWKSAANADQTARQALEYYRAIDEQRRILEEKDIVQQLKSDAAQKFREDRVIREINRKTSVKENKIRKNITRLHNLITHESDYKNVPERLKGFVGEVVKTFGSDFGAIVFSGKKANEIIATYESLKTMDDSFMNAFYDEDMAETLCALKEWAVKYQALVTGKKKNRMEHAQLRALIVDSVSDIVNNVKTLVDNSTEMRINGRKQKFATIANSAIDQMMERPDHLTYQNKLGDAATWLERAIVTGNMTPVYFFDHMGNTQFKNLFKDFQRGAERWAFISANAKQAIAEMKEQYKYNAWVGGKALTFTTQQGYEITLNKEQALWMYATWKREHSNPIAATEHLTKGGFVFEGNKGAVAKKTRLGNKSAEVTTGYLISEEDMQTVHNYLTEQEKSYADAMVKFISEEMGRLGNDVSMELYGIRKFKEGYYFPYAIVQDQKFQKSADGGGAVTNDSRIKHASFTHALTQGANTALVMGNFTDVVASHIGQMANYASMTLPIENMNRVLNYRFDSQGGNKTTMRSLIRQKYGSNTLVYMQRFLRDVNGGVRADKSAFQKTISLFKKSAVVASLSVSLQQTSAMLRAGAMMNYKYLLQQPLNYKKEYNQLMEHSGVAIIKQMGRFDTNVGQSYTEWLSSPEDANLNLWGKIKNRSEEMVTSLPNTMDEVAWGMLWKAVKSEQADLHPNMDKTSNEFLDMCGERFNDIAYHTQVFDSTLSRSQLMRSNSAIDQMATAFRAEPTLTLNVLYDAFFNKNIPKGERAKRRASALSAVMLSSIAAAFGSAMISAWGDDDDDRTAAEKLVRTTNENFWSNLLPWYNIPYISDIVSLLEGYDVERADMSLFQDVVNGFNKVQQWRKGNTTWYRALEEFGGSLANFLGVPAKNIMRDLRRIYNMTNTRWEKPTQTGMTAALMPDAAIPGLEYDTSTTAYYDRLVSAYAKGDTTKAKDIETYIQTVGGKDTEQIRNGVKAAVGDRFEAGAMTEKEGTNLLYKLYGKEKNFDKDSLFFYFDKLKDKMSGKIGTGDTYSKLGDFYTAIETGKGLNDEITMLKKHGSTDKSLASAITSHFKETYISLYKTNKAEASRLQARLLTAYEVLGYKREDKIKDIQKWVEDDEK